MKSFGAIAYDAYREHTGGVSIVTGELLPAWSDLPDEVKAAWEEAAQAVRTVC